MNAPPPPPPIRQDCAQPSPAEDLTDNDSLFWSLIGEIIGKSAAEASRRFASDWQDPVAMCELERAYDTNGVVIYRGALKR